MRRRQARLPRGPSSTLFASRRSRAGGPSVASAPQPLRRGIAAGGASFHPIWAMTYRPSRVRLAGNEPDDGAFGTTDGGTTMSGTDAELGPVDYVVVAFPAGEANFSGEMASELRALMESNTVRVLDLLLVTKDEDGSVEAAELRDADDSEVGQLRAAEADLAVLLAASDVDEIGQVLEPGSTAAVLVWENAWAAPFGAAVRRSGGQLVASGRIPAQAILAAMDADRAAKAEGA